MGTLLNPTDGSLKRDLIQRTRQPGTNKGFRVGHGTVFARLVFPNPQSEP